MCSVTSSTRETKSGSIPRTITISVEDGFGAKTVYASVLEVKQLKTKTGSSCNVYILNRACGVDAGPFEQQRAGAALGREDGDDGHGRCNPRCAGQVCVAHKKTTTHGEKL
jgi:hypothetical protein